MNGLFIGITALDLPTLFSGAKRRIILHAGVYGAFASPRHAEALRKALSHAGFLGLDVVELPPENTTPWRDSFLRCLRFDVSPRQAEEEVAASHAFLLSLARDYPDRVRVHPARMPPSLPLVIIDDAIIFGHYAHCAEHAPEGFWCKVDSDVERLLRWADAGRPPESATPEETAAFRLVCECTRAMGPNWTSEAPCT
jgi:sugar phosphate isomerase/epimerase